MNLAQLSSETLTARVGQLLGHERRLVVAFLFHLAELEDRQLHLRLGHSSLFVYCTDALRLSKAAAFRRTTAARLLRRFPRAAPYLESGALCLTTLVELREVLTDENHERTLADAAGKTEDQVRELVAALRPRPAPPDLFRRLPAPPSSGPEPDAPQSSPSDHARPAEPPPSSRTRGRLEPISDELRVLRVTVGREFAQDLDKVRALLSHKLPSGALEQVLHECIRQTIAACEKRRRGGTKSRTARPKPASPQPPSRHIPTEVRRAVWERDEGRCAFVGTTGIRCGSTHRIEFHHLHPFALGGEATVPNIALRCARHNAYEAEQELGRAHMDAARERRAYADYPERGSFSIADRSSSTSTEQPGQSCSKQTITSHPSG
jgi:5-methylcytosine-specific restriction endonuclease McrA